MPNAYDALLASDPETAKDLAAKVDAGATLLDAKRPGWASVVNLDRLAMDSCNDCVLGQVYGSYITGLYSLGGGLASKRGFDASFDRLGFAYPILADLWCRAVRERLERAK